MPCSVRSDGCARPISSVLGHAPGSGFAVVLCRRRSPWVPLLSEAGKYESDASRRRAWCPDPGAARAAPSSDPTAIPCNISCLEVGNDNRKTEIGRRAPRMMTSSSLCGIQAATCAGATLARRRSRVANHTDALATPPCRATTRLTSRCTGTWLCRVAGVLTAPQPAAVRAGLRCHEADVHEQRAHRGPWGSWRRDWCVAAAGTLGRLTLCSKEHRSRRRQERDAL